VLSKFIWLSINAAMVYSIFELIKSRLPLANFSSSQKRILVLLGILVSLRFLHDNIHTSQITIFILYLCLEALDSITREKFVQGALLLALGINIKLLPIVFLPYLFYRGYFRAGWMTLVFLPLLLYIPALLIGWDQNQQLLDSYARLINPLNRNHVLDLDENSFHSLSTLFATYLSDHPVNRYGLSWKQNVADLSFERLSMLLNGVRLLLAVFSLYFFRSLPFKRARTNLQQFWEISYLLLLIPLMFPHQQHYAFLFACPAAVYVSYYCIQFKPRLSKQKYYLLISSFVLAFLMMNLQFLVGEFSRYYEHFKILTFGTLLLIPVLAACVPPKEGTALLQE
jgi:hypothetical protein